MDMADFKITKGLPVLMYVINASFISTHCRSKTPISTSMPASCSIARPLPATNGLGSIIPMTTLEIPAAITRLAHGGVFP